MTAREATAYHEAGHSVIGRRLGLVCGDVSIVETAEGLGSAEIVSPERTWERGEGPRRQWAEAFAVALYAGAEAEKYFMQTNGEGDGLDEERATDALTWGGVRGASFVGDEAYDRAAARLRAQARRLVHMHASAIRAVAQALLDRDALSSAEVADLMRWAPAGLGKSGSG